MIPSIPASLVSWVRVAAVSFRRTHRHQQVDDCLFE
jgi:hypothetical protein